MSDGYDEQDLAAQEALRAFQARRAPLDEDALDLLFREARTVNAWQERDISDETLHELFDLVKMGPTSANCCPSRFYALRSREARDRLAPCMSSANRNETTNAPVVIVVAYDSEFYEQLGFLCPQQPAARSWFTSSEAVAHETAFRNGTLQGGYLILAARALGLDCGPMSGFNNAKVDEEFFTGTSFKSNFLCAIGYGVPESVAKREPRFAFDQWCKVL